MEAKERPPWTEFRDWQEMRTLVATWPDWWRTAVLEAAPDMHWTQWNPGQSYGILMSALASHAEENPEFAARTERYVTGLWFHRWSTSVSNYARWVILRAWRLALEEIS